MAVLHLHEHMDDVALVLPAPDTVALGMKVKSRDGTIYKVVKREDATDPETGEVVKTWWECLPA